MQYVIYFPEIEAFAGDHKGAAGFAPTPDTAFTFSEETEAAHFAANAYGPAWVKAVVPVNQLQRAIAKLGVG